MATKKKSNGKATPAEPSKPEKTPAEIERQALLAEQPDETLAGEIWDLFADDLTAHSKGVKESMTHSINGSLAMGAKIVEFIKKPEVQAQVKMANFDRRGKPWKDYNWVADQLDKTYDGLPTPKHMGDCARGYLRALETGQIGKGAASLRKLLDWTPSSVPTLTGKVLEDANSGPLPKATKDPKPDTPARAAKTTDPRAELITALHDSNESIQHWIDQCKAADLDLTVDAVTNVSAPLYQTLETM